MLQEPLSTYACRRPSHVSVTRQSEVVRQRRLALEQGGTVMGVRLRNFCKHGRGAVPTMPRRKVLTISPVGSTTSCTSI